MQGALLSCPCLFSSLHHYLHRSGSGTYIHTHTCTRAHTHTELLLSSFLGLEHKSTKDPARPMILIPVPSRASHSMACGLAASKCRTFAHRPATIPVGLAPQLGAAGTLELSTGLPFSFSCTVECLGRSPGAQQVPEPGEHQPCLLEAYISVPAYPERITPSLCSLTQCRLG